MSSNGLILYSIYILSRDPSRPYLQDQQMRQWAYEQHLLRHASDGYYIKHQSKKNDPAFPAESARIP